MTAETKRVLEDALSLPTTERRGVAEALLDSMSPKTVDEIELA